MGKIISTKVRDSDHLVFEVLVDYDEAIQLHGYMHNVHVFSEEAPSIPVQISQRGTNAATKYFLVPRELRKDIEFNSKISCQKIVTKTKTVFIYVVDNMNF